MSHPSPVHESWKASLWAPLVFKKGIQLSPISRAAPAAIRNEVQWAEKARQPLETCVSHGGLPSGLSCKRQLCWCLQSAICKNSFLSPAWNLERNPKKGPLVDPVQFVLQENSSFIPAELPGTLCSYLIGIPWPEHTKGSSYNSCSISNKVSFPNSSWSFPNSSSYLLWPSNYVP